jgi:hypothetical protein
MDRSTLNRVLHGQADANIRFDDLRRLLKNIGFEERTKGSRHIFARPGVSEILNLQVPRIEREALSGQASA